MQNAERVALYLEGLETPNALAITDQRNEARAWAVCTGGERIHRRKRRAFVVTSRGSGES